jgi:hypothetical protein
VAAWFARLATAHACSGIDERTERLARARAEAAAAGARGGARRRGDVSARRRNAGGALPPEVAAGGAAVLAAWLRSEAGLASVGGAEGGASVCECEPPALAAPAAGALPLLALPAWLRPALDDLAAEEAKVQGVPGKTGAAGAVAGASKARSAAAPRSPAPAPRSPPPSAPAPGPAAPSPLLVALRRRARRLWYSPHETARAFPPLAEAEAAARGGAVGAEEGEGEWAAAAAAIERATASLHSEWAALLDGLEARARA